MTDRQEVPQLAHVGQGWHYLAAKGHNDGGALVDQGDLASLLDFEGEDVEHGAGEKTDSQAKQLNLVLPQ